MNSEVKTMATDAIVRSSDEPQGRPPVPQRAEKEERQGYFTIYKKGQGYWTRICTAAAAGAIILLTANFIWSQLPPQLLPYLTPENPTGPQSIAAAQTSRRITGALCVSWMIGASLLAWYLINKPTNADFLIATDSEMKKVNWTSKQELIGSTKVVIIFMLMIATLLFVLDMYFTRLFYLLGVLVTDSPLWSYVGDNFGRTGQIGLDIVTGTVIFGGAAWAIYETLRTK